MEHRLTDALGQWLQRRRSSVPREAGSQVHGHNGEERASGVSVVDGARYSSVAKTELGERTSKIEVIKHNGYSLRTAHRTRPSSRLTFSVLGRYFPNLRDLIFTANYVLKTICTRPAAEQEALSGIAHVPLICVFMVSCKVRPSCIPQ